MMMKKLGLLLSSFSVFVVLLLAIPVDAQLQIPTLKQQIKEGIEQDNLLCDLDLVLMVKISFNSPACVKPSTALILDERGWGVILKDAVEMDEQRQKFLENNTIEELEENPEPIEEQKESDSQVEEVYNPEINPDDFVSTINNPFFTLIPGTTFVYESETEDGLERIETVVTEDKKNVMGIQTTIVWDREWLDGVLVEDTKDWYAQDKQGNVWYFGEQSQEFEDGILLGTFGSWESGIDGAIPGIIMKALPEVGDMYKQEYYEGVAEDMAEVVEIHAAIQTDFAYFSNCVKTRDWTPLESDSEEYKYYCLKVNNLVMEEKVSDGETVIIVDVGSEELITDITPNQAKTIALKEVPGVVTEIVREGFRGKTAYAVEIQDGFGNEIDVFVDIKTGKILGKET